MLEAHTQEYLLRGRERDVNSAPGLYGTSAKKRREKKKFAKAAFRGVKYCHEASHPATSRLTHGSTESDTLPAPTMWSVIRLFTNWQVHEIFCVHVA